MPTDNQAPSRYRVKQRRRFIVRFLLLAIILSAGYFWLTRPEPAPAGLTEAERMELGRQQSLYAPWDAAHQRHIQQLDRTWQQFDRILGELRTENIEVADAAERLADLAADAQDNLKRIQVATIPPGLWQEVSEPAGTIYRRTVEYAVAQLKTIREAARLAGKLAEQDLAAAEDSRRLDELKARLAPVGLFTEKQLMAIRDALTIPGER